MSGKHSAEEPIVVEIDSGRVSVLRAVDELTARVKLRSIALTLAGDDVWMRSEEIEDVLSQVSGDHLPEHLVSAAESAVRALAMIRKAVAL